MFKLKQYRNGIEQPPVDVEKQQRTLGGANKNPVKGVYRVPGKPGQNPSPPLMIKAETRNAGKEFSELLAGAFIGKVINQRDFAYRDNFVLTEPGVISYPETPNKPDQRVMVQPFSEGAESLLKDRRGGEELIPDLKNLQSGTEKSRQLAKDLDKPAFAATIVMSVLIADYSVHLDNFMKVGGTKPLRVDFGSSCKNILRKENNKDVYSSPPGTKPYKKYMEIWTDDPQIKASITEFIWKNKAYFSPEKMSQMMGEACKEVLNAAYKDAPLEDLLQIYKHLHGENHPALKGQLKNDYKEIKALNKQRNALIEEQAKASESKQIAFYSKIKAIDDQLALKSIAFNNRDDADDLKQDIKKGIVEDMKKEMINRANAVVKEAIELGHDQRLAQIEKENAPLAKEIKQTEKLINAAKEDMQECKDLLTVALPEFRRMLDAADVTPGEKHPSVPYVEIRQADGKSKFYTMESIKAAHAPLDPLEKFDHPFMISKIKQNFGFLANTQQNYREARQNLHNLESKVEVLYTGLNKQPQVKEKPNLPLPVPHTQALSPGQPLVSTPVPATATPAGTSNTNAPLQPPPKPG